jgi:predicted esterase
MTIVFSYFRSTIPVTINQGYFMTAWCDLRVPFPIQLFFVNVTFSIRVVDRFDVKGVDRNAEQDEEGIERAMECIRELIEEENRIGIPRHRVLIGGFSQGGALSLFLAIKYRYSLAGVFALSSWLPPHSSLTNVSRRFIN